MTIDFRSMLLRSSSCSFGRPKHPLQYPIILHFGSRVIVWMRSDLVLRCVRLKDRPVIELTYPHF